MPPVSWSPVVMMSVSAGWRSWNSFATRTASSMASTSRRFVAASFACPEKSSVPPSTIMKKPAGPSSSSTPFRVISASEGMDASRSIACGMCPSQAV